MMGENSSRNSKFSAKPPLPGEVLRGLVSLWLIIHLLGVGLGLATNMGMASAGGTSPLLARLKRVPILDQYIFALWFDVGYNYPLYRDLSDIDHIMTATLVYDDGRRETLGSFPGEGVGGENLERYLAMTRRAAITAYDETANNTALIAAIGGAILRNHPDTDQLKEVVLEVRQHNPLSIEDLQSNDPDRHDPLADRTFANVYTGIVSLNRAGQPQVSTPSAARDVAPVTDRSPDAAADPTANSAPATDAPSRPSETDAARPSATTRKAQPKSRPPANDRPRTLPPPILPDVTEQP